MGPTGCPEKFVNNTSEERGFYLHCGGILKSSIEFYESQMMFMIFYCTGKSEGIPEIVVP